MPSGGCFGGCLFRRRRRQNQDRVLEFIQQTRRSKKQNWEKKGSPRNMSVVTPYTMRRNITNNISLDNFNKGNIVYLYFRNKLGKVPVAYSGNSLRGLIQNNHLDLVTNLNNYLSRVKNNKVLFKNTHTRKPIKRKYIRKVKLI